MEINIKILNKKAKNLFILIFSITFLFSIIVENSFAGSKTKLRRGEIYSGTITYEGGVNIELPSGEWKMIGGWFWSVNAVRASGKTFVQLDGNILKGIVSLLHVDSGGKWIGHINDWIRSVYVVNKTDGCYERSEYYLVERTKTGAAFNCLVVRHIDVNKEMFNPDKDAYKLQVYKEGFFKAWVKKNNIEVPSILLISEHVFYAPSVSTKILGLQFDINPELYGASESQFRTEETSEYHRANINKYLDKKKFMNNWIKLAAQRHRKFEKNVNAKAIHKLDLSKYGKVEVNKQTATSQTTSTEEKTINIVDQLNELKELYKEGALNKEEFEKAKEILLKLQ